VAVRLLTVLGSVLYIFAGIGAVAYLGVSMFWLIPVLAPALYFIFMLPDLPGLRAVPQSAPTPVSAEWRAKIEARIEELKKGPPHRNKPQYIDAISRGIPYSDERIDYLEFTDRLVLCEHLRPLEAVMRASRLPMENYRKGMVEVQCILQVSEIQQRYNFANCVEFGQGPGTDNHAPPVNVIHCKRCGDSIEENGMYGRPWPES
jgi:hypothetical protein